MPVPAAPTEPGLAMVTLAVRSIGSRRGDPPERRAHAALLVRLDGRSDGRLQIIAFILHLGLDSRGPTVARAQAPPDFSELGPSYDGADPAYAD